VPPPLAAQAQPDAEWNQAQPQKESQRQDDEEKDAQIGVAGALADFHREDEQPGHAGGGDQKYANEADRVIGEVNERLKPAARSTK